MPTVSRTKTGWHLTVAGALLSIWGAVAWYFYAPSTPLGKVEIDDYMVNVQRLLETSFVMPEGAGPDARGLAVAMSDLRGFAERDDGKAIYMVNLMKWREGELLFPAGADLADSIASAREADIAYNEELFWTLLANHSHTSYLSKAETNALNYGVTAGAEADGWGEVGIFRYNSRRDFFNMITSDSYLSIMYLKMVSMGTIALVPSQPHGLIFNPMPNMPVLLGFGFIIAYLLVLVVSRRSEAGLKQR